ncbi:MAG: hypothetical protein R2706_06925 [Acidimicrobiales bacterium]
MSRIAVLGLGASGLVVATSLEGTHDVSYHDVNPDRMALGRRTLQTAVCAPSGAMEADVVVLATPTGRHGAQAKQFLDAGVSVVSMSDAPGDISALLALDAFAAKRGLTLIVGAGMAPGLSCLLARHAGNALDSVEEIAVAKTGTGGPACARQHHRALKRPGRDWLEGEWVMRRGGSGRELLWFPDPIGALDCYRGDLASPLLLQRVYDDAGRISARMSATRRDRLTYRLPMLRRPHADGGPGGIRVEVRGLRAGAFETLVYGCMSHPSTAAGLISASAARHVVSNEAKAGAYGLAEVDEPLRLLRPLVDGGLAIVAIGATG